MRMRAAIACVICAHAQAQNLVANPGFDQVGPMGMPKHWDLFIMPMDGAEGRLDTPALSEPYAAMLHNPEPYPKEPANNWSQVLLAPLEGKELLIAGNIRTQDATEASLWIQCFQKDPPRVLAAATTSTDTPVYGNTDWTPVEMKLKVPQGTRFLILRCVLQGRGTAWFDTLRVEERTAQEEGPAESTDTSPAGEDLEEPGIALEQSPSGEDTEAIRDALENLQALNEALRTQMQALETELADLRDELAKPPLPAPPSLVPRPGDSQSGDDRLQSISPRANASPPLEPPAPTHPLIPHRDDRERTGTWPSSPR